MSAEVVSAGIDTWSPCWWLEPTSPAANLMTSHASVGSARGRLLPDAVAGHRVGWHPSSGLLYAEGHPAEGRLAAAAELPAALDRLEGALLAAGLPLPIGRRGEDLYGDRHEGFAGIRRLDSTADLAMASAAEGLAVMTALAAIAGRMPRVKADVWMREGHVQTVALHGHAGRRMLGRFYDKGLESGTARPGELLRPEDQRRWPKGLRRGVGELSGHYVREKFRQRFVPLWRASKGVTVAGHIVLAEKLAELVDDEVISHRVAESLAGFLLLDSLGAYRGPGRTRRRRRADLQEHGLVLADGLFQEVEIDLAGVLEEALETDLWGAEG